MAPAISPVERTVPTAPVATVAPINPSVPKAPVAPSISTDEMSGKILGRIGIGAVVIGVAFFLKYAFDNNWIGPSGRVLVGIIIGLGLLALGQWLRKKYLSYSDLLMGGGLAVLYLSVYAAFALYQLVDPMTAFLGMIIVTAIGVGISIVNATISLSVIALIGGYLAPSMIGVALIGPWVTFTYLTILNAGLLGILIYKKWAPLVLIGLIGTWLHFGSWLAMSYTTDLLVPTLFFVMLQFLIFTAASVARLIFEKLKAEDLDFAMLAATALSFAAVLFSLLNALYKDYLSLSFVAVAVFYGAIAIAVRKRSQLNDSLNIFLPGLSVAFLTAAIAIEFSGPWIAVWWLVEALVLYVVALKSSSRGYQVMGVVVYVLGLIRLFDYIFNYRNPIGYVVFFNGPFVMLCLAIAVAYAIAFVYFRFGSTSPEIQKNGISVFAVIANVLSVYALTSQIVSYYALQMNVSGIGYAASNSLQNSSNTAVSILWALYAAMLTIIGFAKDSLVARRMGLALFILSAFKVLVDVWSLGQLYRIVSFIVFGVIALAASFIYVKYRDRLKGVV